MGQEGVTGFLRAQGCPDEVVSGGFEGLVAGWERTAAQVRGGYPLGLDDYLNDIDARQLIEDVVAQLPDAGEPALMLRVQAADLAMREAIDGTDECLWGEAIADREGWTPDENWWYFGLPREPGPQLREELEDLE
jgi:hypothetical protein